MKSNSTELKVKYHGDKDKPTRKKNPNVADISRQGYRDDSPYRSMPYIDIYAPGGSIDMSNTGIPLWANGRILPPYSGIHQFDTTQIKEIPLARQGGWLKQYQSNKETGEIIDVDPKTANLPVVDLPAVDIIGEAKKPWYDKFIPKPLKRIKENLGTLNTSYGYDMSPVDVLMQAVGLNKNDKSMNFEKYPEFDVPSLTEHDAWRMYLGLPQEYHSFEPSQYEKGAYQIKGYSDSFPEKWPSEEEIKKGLDYDFFKSAKTSGDRKASLKPWGDFVMGRHRVTPGSDDGGKYLEYYDEWDLDSYKYNDIPVGKAFDKLMGNPFKIRGRVYYAKDPETGEYMIQRKKGGSFKWLDRYQTKGEVLPPSYVSSVSDIRTVSGQNPTSGKYYDQTAEKWLNVDENVGDQTGNIGRIYTRSTTDSDKVPFMEYSSQSPAGGPSRNQLRFITDEGTTVWNKADPFMQNFLNQRIDYRSGAMSRKQGGSSKWLETYQMPPGQVRRLNNLPKSVVIKPIETNIVSDSSAVPIQITGSNSQPGAFPLGSPIQGTPPSRFTTPTGKNTAVYFKKQGGSKLPSHLPEAYKAGGSWTNQYQTGGATVRQIWEATTGKKWADAKKEGLTDGSYESNKALEKKLRAGDFGKLVVPKVVQPKPPIQAAGPARLSDQGYTMGAFRPAAGRTVTQARQDVADRERAEQENASRMLYMGALNQANKQLGARDATASSKTRTQEQIKQRMETPITAQRDDTKLAPEGSLRSYVQKAVNFMDLASRVSTAPGSEIGTSFITAPLQAGLNISNTVMGDRPIRSDADIGSLAWDVATVAPFVGEAVPLVKSAGRGLKNVKQEILYRGIDPTGYGAKQKAKEFFPNLYRNTVNPDARALRIGEALYEGDPVAKRTLMRLGQNRLDAWRVGLGLDQKYNTFTRLKDGTYKLRNTRNYTPDYFRGLQREINLSRRNSPNQILAVNKAKDPNFKNSVFAADSEMGVMGQYRWDVGKTDDGLLHFRLNDTWDLHPWQRRGTVYKETNELDEFMRSAHRKPFLENVEVLGLLGGKPYNISNNFIVDPKTFQVIKRFNEGGNMKKSWLDKYQGTKGKSQTGSMWLNPITGQYVQQGIETSASPLDLVGGIGNIPGLLRGTGAMVMNLLNKPHRQVVTSTRDAALMGYGYEDPKMSYPSRPSGPVPAFYPWPKSYQVGGESEESEGPVMKPRMASVEAGKDIPEVTVTQETENFGDAFKKARSSGLKTFTWRGKVYTTQYKSEVEKKKAPVSAAPKQQSKKTEAKPQPKPQVQARFPLSMELQRSQYPQAKTSAKPKVAAQPARTAPQQGGYSVVVTDPQGSRVTSPVVAAPKAAPVVSAPVSGRTGTLMNIPAINYGYNTAPASTTEAVTGTIRGVALPAKTQKPQAAKLQNQQPQNVAADMKDQQTNMMGNALSQLNQKDQRQLPQTGVIIDKRTGQAYVKTGSDIYSYPVLTGKNVEGNITGGSTPDDERFLFKTTPRGYYTLQDQRMINGKLTPIDASDVEGGLARWMVPINAFGMPASDAVYNAMHGTYLGDYANRNPRYNQPSDKRWVSYGCVNARECDLKKTFNDIAVGDTSLVLDSNYPQDAALLQMIQNQQAAIRLPLVADTKVKKTGGDVKNWLEKYK